MEWVLVWDCLYSNREIKYYFVINLSYIKVMKHLQLPCRTSRPFFLPFNTHTHKPDTQLTWYHRLLVAVMGGSDGNLGMSRNKSCSPFYMCVFAYYANGKFIEIFLYIYDIFCMRLWKLYNKTNQHIPNTIECIWCPVVNLFIFSWYYCWYFLRVSGENVFKGKQPWKKQSLYVLLKHAWWILFFF